MEQSAIIERDCALGGLFQQIINEMKNTTPLWEDLAGKSTKLHTCLRSTIQAVSAFLDAFQKIADAATSTKGATKDIGTALTRICLRHKAIEAKMKTFTSSIMDCLILPLQERLEEWKKTTVILDKDHAKEYKRSRAELKKRSIETLRLQKKLRKGGLNNGGMSGSFSGTLPRSGGGMGSGIGSSGESLGLQGGANRDLNRILEVALRDTAEKRQTFEDTEKQAIRNALVEERSRFCLFVSYLKPVVDEEVGMLYELQHVQEAMLQLEKHSIDPFSLPPASEQVIADLKGSCDSGAWSFQTPPSSPSSLGSRKSSMCSISSANSSSSGSAHSPSHNVHHRTIHHPPMTCHPTGTLRYSSVSSQDSGFMSQDALFSRMPTPFFDHRKGGNQSEGSNTSSTASSNSSTPSSPYPPGSIPTTNATWPNVQDSIQFERAACAIMNERPHTISSSYERGHQRPPLTVYTFQPPADSSSHPASPTATPVVTPILEPQSHTMQGVYQSASEIYGILRGKSDAKPPVPKRGSSLERPQLTSGSSANNSISGNGTPKPFPKNSKGSKDSKRDQVQMNNKVVPNLPDFNQSSDDMIVPQPVYVNMHELNQMASAKLQRQAELDLPPPPPELMTPPTTKVDGLELNNLKSEGSLASSGYGSQNQIVMCEDSNSGGSGSSTLEGEHNSHDTVDSVSVRSSIPLSSEEFRMELESMINSMGSSSTSFRTEPPDHFYDLPVRNLNGRGGPNPHPPNHSSGNESCTNGTSFALRGGTVPRNFLLQHRHHSMHMGPSNNSAFEYASLATVIPSLSNANANNIFADPSQTADTNHCNNATIRSINHRSFLSNNPHVPVLNGNSLHNSNSNSIHNQVAMQVQRNNSLPRPHSYAAPNHTNFMKYRLSMAKKRDFV